MGKAFSDKEVAFSFSRVISRWGEGCSFIKLSGWLNAKVEHSESAHHIVTGKKEGYRKEQETKEKYGRRLFI